MILRTAVVAMTFAAAHAALSRDADAVSGGAACETALDCWLNGDCINSQCACDAAWDGAACNVLAELSSVQLWPPPSFPPPTNLSQLASSWDASIAQDAATGTYHAYFNVVCANYTYMHVPGAAIVHAVSSSGDITGPYTYSGITVPQQ